LAPRKRPQCWDKSLRPLTTGGQPEEGASPIVRTSYGRDRARVCSACSRLRASSQIGEVGGDQLAASSMTGNHSSTIPIIRLGRGGGDSKPLDVAVWGAAPSPAARWLRKINHVRRARNGAQLKVLSLYHRNYWAAIGDRECCAPALNGEAACDRHFVPIRLTPTACSYRSALVEPLPATQTIKKSSAKARRRLRVLRSGR